MDEIKKEIQAFVFGEYVFSETDNANQFYFYRNDGQVLGEVNGIPMFMYKKYICQQMFDGKIKSMVMNDICFEESDDNRCIRLTVYNIGSKGNNESIEIANESTFGQKIKSLLKRRKK